MPATEGGQGDPRWRTFADRSSFDPARPVQWEAEPLEPAELQSPVLAVVDRHAPARQIAREEEQRQALATFIEGWGQASGVAPA
ncbi:hypothetical protein [Streptomyces sp. NPDC056132]|uniref:hypothetical protein n=1 Tax=Streptomyces sp. NPDC056132 TaxID=3345722 RepID=UPI0035E09DB1